MPVCFELTLFTGPTFNGVMLLVLAFLVSPYGLPLDILSRTGWVWGANPSKRFSRFAAGQNCEKYASVATFTLLSEKCSPQSIPNLSMLCQNVKAPNIPLLLWERHTSLVKFLFQQPNKQLHRRANPFIFMKSANYINQHLIQFRFYRNQ